MRSPTNLFIANLACADLLVNVLCLPFTLIGNLLSAWIMGWLICKTVPYLQGVSVSASINTLVAISVERCLAICYPLRWQVTARTCRRTVTLIWLFSLTITLPWAVVFGLAPLHEGSDAHVCTELWPSALSENVYFALAHLLMCYLFPLALISACYLLIWRRVCRRTPPGERCVAALSAAAPPSGVDVMIHRSKVKVVKMLLVVVVSFALSWLPLYALFARVKFGGPPRSDSEEALIHAALPVAQWLGASNSCVNPVLYTAFNKKFRAAFRAILSSRSCCGPLRYDDSFATSSARSSFHCKLARGVTLSGGAGAGASAAAAAAAVNMRRQAGPPLLRPTRSAGALLTYGVAAAAAATTGVRPATPSSTGRQTLSMTAEAAQRSPSPATTFYARADTSEPRVRVPPRRIVSAYSLRAAAAVALPTARTIHSFVGLAAAGEGYVTITPGPGAARMAAARGEAV